MYPPFCKTVKAVEETDQALLRHRGTSLGAQEGMACSRAGDSSAPSPPRAFPAQAAAQAGSTAAPEATADIDLHFVTFVEHGGRLYELDGWGWGLLWGVAGRSGSARSGPAAGMACRCP